MLRSLFAAAGVDFDQWSALTITALKLDFRTSSLGQNQFRRDASRVLGLIGQFVFYTVVGGALSFLVWFSADLFLVGTVAMTYTMFMVGTAVLIDHNSALASPVDYAILGFRPITSRTYFAVRLTNVLAYTTLITTLAVWLPVLMFFFRHNAVIGLAGLTAFYACSIGTVLTILVAYAWMLRAFGPAAVARALSYLQLILSFAVYGGYFVVMGLVTREATMSLTLEKSPWLLLYPATWFASYLELASGTWGMTEIVPALASVIAIAAVTAALGSRLSLGYSERLAALTTTTNPSTLAPRIKWPTLPWFRTGEARAVAMLVRSQFRNDQRFRMGVLAVLPMTAIYLLIALRRGTIQDPFIGHGGESGFMPVTMALMMFPSLLKLQITNSESFKASWIFFAAPVDRMAVVRSSKNVLMAFFLIPYLLFLIAVYSYFVGNVLHVAIHIALLGLLGHLTLQMAVLIDPALPFSRPLQKGRNSIVMMVFLTVTAAISTALDAFSAAVYGSMMTTVAAFGSIAGVSAVVDWLTHARVQRETRSLEFEG